MTTGFLSHIDFSVGNPADSIPFYETFLTALGYVRWGGGNEDWQGQNPTRAAWGIRYPDGSTFGVDLRQANKQRRYDRCEPGPHHIAFVAADHDTVDQVYQAMLDVGAQVLDPPFDYGGQDGYGDHYYALFVADPDGVKLEVCCTESIGQ